LGGSGTKNGNNDVDLLTLSGDAPVTTQSGEAAPPESGQQQSGEDGPAVAAPVDILDVLARGATVGRYLVLERLGAGAMGVVYAAYDPELDRKIALKLLRPQPGTSDLTRRQARMVREAKAIARVSHPNVVAIFDVGVHEGQVFMAMEHLAGGTLKSWLADKKRSWREVLAMFAEVGRGLAGAHAERLIHRDFKPDNVLLDKNGVPKVVDFGLVRLSADADATASAALAETVDANEPAPLSSPEANADLTRTGALTGTPAYMAPEQFRAQAVDARTDQFAFCVALYEGLYGQRPFPGDNLLSLADSVVNGRVREAPRATDIPGWVRSCVLRGLRTNPADRHPDLERLLAVLANDPAKRRKKWALAGTGVAMLVASVGVTHRLGSRQRTMCTSGAEHFAGIWEPGPGGTARKEAVRRAFAATGKSYAEQAFTGVVRLFDQYVARWTGMYAEACQATHVRGEQSEEVLDLRMACLKGTVDNARALSDVFAAADGKVVENAVSAAAGLPTLERCADVVQLRAVVRPPENPETRKRVYDLRGELARMIAVRDSGQCAPAIQKAGALITEAREVGYQPLLADVLYASGEIGIHCGDVTEMLERFREAHAAATASHSDEVAAQASALIPSFAMNRLGQAIVAREWLGVAQGDVARLTRETLAHAMLAQAEGMMALSERDYGRALASADRSIAVTRNLLGPDDPLTIQWEANKGDWQEAAGLLPESLKETVQARQHLERVLGRDHPRVAPLWINQGEVLHLLGQYGEAEAAYQSAVRLYRQSGADADVLAWALTGVGRALVGQKQLGAAVAPLEEALAIRIEKRASSVQLGETRFALARALWSRPAERRRALALGISAKADYGDDKKAVAEIDTWLAEARGKRI
jgi:tetratricopeptide (TPR) repeat protein